MYCTSREIERSCATKGPTMGRALGEAAAVGGPCGRTAEDNLRPLSEMEMVSSCEQGHDACRNGDAPAEEAVKAAAEAQRRAAPRGAPRDAARDAQRAPPRPEPPLPPLFGPIFTRAEAKR